LQQKKKAKGDQQDGITSAAQGAGDLEDQQITPGYTYDYFEKLVKAAARRTAGVEGPAAEVDASTPGAAVGAVKAAAASTADAGKQAVGAATARVGSAAQAVKKGAAKAAGGIAKAGTTAVADATKAASAAAGSVTKSVAKAGEGAARAAGGLVAGAKAAAGSVTKSVTNSVARSVTKAGLQAVYPLTTGRLFFYLSPMDATTQNLLVSGVPCAGRLWEHHQMYHSAASRQSLVCGWHINRGWTCRGAPPEYGVLLLFTLREP
jgi:hypothetical protein